VLDWASSEPGCTVAGVHQRGAQVEVHCETRAGAEALFGCTLANYVNTAVEGEARAMMTGSAEIGAMAGSAEIGTATAEKAPLSRSVVRARGGLYSVPGHLAGVVSFVSGLNRFERLLRHEVAANAAATVVRSTRGRHGHRHGDNHHGDNHHGDNHHGHRHHSGSGSGSDASVDVGGGIAVTPRVLRHRYNISDVTSKSGNSSVSVTALIGQYYSPADLEEFFVLFSQSNIGRNVSRVIGPNHGAGIEANLDVQTVGGMTDKGIDMWFWSIAQNAPNNEPFAEWVSEIASTATVPYIHTTSYGGSEADESPAYLLRMDEEFQKMGLRGLTVLFAAGDSGVGCGKGGATAPDWPASAPHVTAVGGTKFSGLFETGHEVVNGLSGGGFSNVYPRPAWQDAAVSGYLSKMADHLPKAAFNRSGRGYPDTTALSSGFTVVDNKVPVPGVAGTSCASPTVAAIFALVNDRLISAGKPVLGFANIALYQSLLGTDAVFDVTEGKQNACPLATGFPPSAGWDPSSGTGSPNFPGIIAKLA
jgi:subtilase family serine protease